MSPEFGSFDDEIREYWPTDRRRRLKMAGVAVALALLIGMLFGAEPSLLRGSSVIPTVLVISFLTSLIMAVVVSGSRKARLNTEKRKRGLGSQDMYSLIDRMVDDLDGDELDYLYQRLAVLEHGPKRETAESLNELLTEREAEREAGKR